MNTTEPLLAPVHLCGLGNATNSSCSRDGTEDPFSKTLRITVTSAYVIVFITSILGNGLGLRVVFRPSSMSRFSCLLIGNKAFADLLTTLFITPYMVFYVHNKNAWFGGIAGTTTCKFSQFPFAVSLAASVFTVVTISVDRFIAVVYPLYRRRFLPNPKTTTVIIWVSSVALMSAPCLIPYRAIQLANGQYYCGAQWGGYEKTIKIQKWFYMALFVLMYLLPLLITVTTLTSVSRHLWQRKIPGDSSRVRKRTAQKINRQIAMLLILIMIVFAVCWAPAHAMHYLVFETEWRQIPVWVPFLSFWLCHAASAIDPFLYIICNCSFRKEIKNTISTCYRLNKLPKKSSSYTLNVLTSRVAPFDTNKLKLKPNRRCAGTILLSRFPLRLPQQADTNIKNGGVDHSPESR